MKIKSDEALFNHVSAFSRITTSAKLNQEIHGNIYIYIYILQYLKILTVEAKALLTEQDLKESNRPPIDTRYLVKPNPMRPQKLTLVAEHPEYASKKNVFPIEFLSHQSSS